VDLFKVSAVFIRSLQTDIKTKPFIICSIADFKLYIMENREDELFNEQDSQKDNAETKGSNTVKDPDDWTTGNEPMTGAQQSYLKTLSDEAGEPFDETLSKSEASKRIDELQHKTGRGLDNNQKQ
jgi:hypothetical protein